MNNVRVECDELREGWSCRVTVGEGAASTEHEVSVSPAELERLAPGADDPHELVRESFAYLLEREPKESILRRFEISAIERYFPSYPDEISRRL